MDFESEMRAMVLCAGLGTRLGELTRQTPKALLPLHGRPILEYILANLRRHGFDEIAINLHTMPETIRGHFGDGAKFGVKLTYSHESVLLGTAGGVKKMEHFFRDGGPFLVHYGDILTDQDFTAMMRFHRERGALVTMLAHQRARSNSVVVLDSERRVTLFLERPEEEGRCGVESPWVNSGICLCETAVLEAIPVGQRCDLPRDVFPGLIPSGRVFGFGLTGYRCAIDSPERLEEAKAALAAGHCHISLAPGAGNDRGLD